MFIFRLIGWWVITGHIRVDPPTHFATPNFRPPTTTIDEKAIRSKEISQLNVGVLILSNNEILLMRTCKSINICKKGEKWVCPFSVKIYTSMKNTCKPLSNSYHNLQQQFNCSLGHSFPPIILIFSMWSFLVCNFLKCLARVKIRNWVVDKAGNPFVKVTSASLIHGINRYLPHLGVLLRVISKAEICFTFLECFNGVFGTHHDKPLNHEQLVVVINQGIQDLAIVWWIC